MSSCFLSCAHSLWLNTFWGEKGYNLEFYAYSSVPSRYLNMLTTDLFFSCPGNSSSCSSSRGEGAQEYLNRMSGDWGPCSCCQMVQGTHLFLSFFVLFLFFFSQMFKNQKISQFLCYSDTVSEWLLTTLSHQDGNPLEPQANRYTETIGSRHRLVFRSVMYTDAGVYTCSADNNRDTPSNSTILLSVLCQYDETF